LEVAWKQKDFRLARALTNSLRITAIQAQAEEEAPGAPLFTATRHLEVESLPVSLNKWAKGWKYCKILTLQETVWSGSISRACGSLVKFSGGTSDFTHA
jgi:hypothetical protein